MADNDVIDNDITKKSQSTKDLGLSCLGHIWTKDLLSRNKNLKTRFSCNKSKMQGFNQIQFDFNNKLAEDDDR